MLTGFDHAVIAVRDLERAVDSFTRLGFNVRPGGRHPTLGTANAVVPFEAGYLELLTVVDRDAGAGAGPVTRGLLDLLAEREGFAGYGITSNDVAADAARIRGVGPAVQVIPIPRENADGTVSSAMLAYVEGTPWFPPWPFLIQRDPAEEQRIRSRPPVTHPNGARRCVRALLAMGDAGDARPLLGGQLGLRADSDGFRVGDFVIRPVAVSGRVGLLELEIAAGDLDRTRRVLPADVISGREAGRIRLDVAATAGAQILLVPG